MLAKTGDRYTPVTARKSTAFRLDRRFGRFYAGFAVLNCCQDAGGANADAVLAAVRALKAVYMTELPYSALTCL